MMRTRGESAGEINVRPERQRGLANQIAIARARRHGDTSKEDVREVETPEFREPSHRDFREDLRRIIAEDAERAANEQDEPAPDVVLEAGPYRKRSHSITTMAWLACLVGVVAVALIR